MIGSLIRLRVVRDCCFKPYKNKLENKLLLFILNLLVHNKWLKSHFPFNKRDYMRLYFQHLWFYALSIHMWIAETRLLCIRASLGNTLFSMVLEVLRKCEIHFHQYEALQRMAWQDVI
ncbi:hypothetical protein ACJX0J_006335 [Zea mays]